MPEPLPSPTVVGGVTRDAAAETGLLPGTPVVIGGGDGSCAGIGAGVIEPGSAYCVIGTSAWISVSTLAPAPDPQQRTMTFHHVHPERYAPMGVMQLAGGAREWAWRALADGDLDLDRAATTVAPGAQGLIFLPYLMGERSPWWDPHARGAFVGLEMTHDKAVLARAVLEGVGFGLRQILDSLREQVGGIDALRLIGGGGRSSLWPQMLADIFRLPIHRLELTGEATSWGAAVAAGVAVGLYDWSIAEERSRVAQIYTPDAQNAAVYDELLPRFPRYLSGTSAHLCSCRCQDSKYVGRDAISTFRRRQAMKTVLCFGDSNTWGSDPAGNGRFDIHTRWPGVLRDELGAEYWVIEEGLGGRTTLWDDPIEGYKNGKEYLIPCLHSHRPLDLVVIMLGTNDLKMRFSVPAFDIANSAGVLVDVVRKSEAGEGWRGAGSSPDRAAAGCQTDRFCPDVRRCGGQVATVRRRIQTCRRRVGLRLLGRGQCHAFQ